MNGGEIVSEKTLKTYVLDTSALLALRSDEPGADRVQSLLVQAKHNRCRILLSFMSRMEVLYCVRREEGEAAAREALRLIDTFSIEWVSCDSAILETAAQIKSSGRISNADCWIAATAAVFDSILVHKDPEFRPLTDIAQEVLT